MGYQAEPFQFLARLQNSGSDPSLTQRGGAVVLTCGSKAQGAGEALNRRQIETQLGGRCQLYFNLNCLNHHGRLLTLCYHRIVFPHEACRLV